MKHIEYEERLIIKESDYQKIIEDINAQKLKGRHLHIENIYLDDKEYSLTDNHKMLRIRTTNNKDVELTFKSRHPSGGHYEINETLEHHHEINLNLDKEFKEYHEVARLITDRIEIPIDDYLFVIDKNHYGNIIDYNIEIEAISQEKAHELMVKYAEKYQIPYKKEVGGKSGRAIALMRK